MSNPNAIPKGSPTVPTHPKHQPQPAPGVPVKAADELAEPTRATDKSSSKDVAKRVHVEK